MNRREFLQHTTLLAGAAYLGSPSLANEVTSPMQKTASRQA